MAYDLDLIKIAKNFAGRMKFNVSTPAANEILVSIMEKNLEYKIRVLLREDADAVCFSCDLGLRVPDEKLDVFLDSMRNINDHILMGKFELSEVNSLNYVLIIPFISYFMWDEDAMESIFAMITSEADKFYQFFSILITGESNNSIESLFVETMGYA